MPTGNYPVASGTDDWSVSYPGSIVDNTSATVTVFESAILGSSRTANCRMDTSALDGKTIVSATLHVYGWTYTKDRGTTIAKYAAIEYGSGFYYIFVTHTTHTNYSWESFALNATAIGYINKSGNTEFRLSVPNPGSTYSRSWVVEMYDNGAGNEMYLEVEYTEASGGPVHRMIIC